MTPTATYYSFVKPITFGDCGCNKLQANFAIIALPYFGINRFDRGITEVTTTKYLRVDRTLVSPATLPSSLNTEAWKGIHIGWWLTNKWTGVETKSHRFFLEPWGWSTTDFVVLSPTTRLINFETTYYNEYGVSEKINISLLETATIPWLAGEARENMYNDLTEKVPWGNPFIFDPSHYIVCYFRYTDDGNLIVNDNYETNPVVLQYACEKSLVVGQDYIGTDSLGNENPGQPFMVGMRLPTNIITKKHVTRIFNTFESPMPPYFCGDVEGVQVGATERVNSGEIIRPPSQLEMSTWGIQPGQWGLTATITC